MHHVQTIPLWEIEDFFRKHQPITVIFEQRQRIRCTEKKIFGDGAELAEWV